MNQNVLLTPGKSERADTHITKLRRSALSLWSIFLVATALVIGIVLLASYQSVLPIIPPKFQGDIFLLFFIVPLAVVLWGVRKFYNCSYAIHADEIIAHQGALGYQYRITRVRFSEIRYTRVCQNIMQRALGYGDLGLFTTNHDCADLKLYGIRNPQEAAALIDRLQAVIKKDGRVEGSPSAADRSLAA